MHHTRPSLILLLLFGLATAMAAAEPAFRDEKGVWQDPTDPERTMRWAARVPTNLPSGRKPALIVTFHGGGMDEESLFYYPTVGLLKTGLGDQAILLGLKSRDRHWGKQDRAPTLAVTDWAIEHFAVDPARVYAYAISSGAIFTGSFLHQHQDRFAAVVHMVGSMRDLPDAEAGRPHTQGWYLMHGDADRIVAVDNSRRAVAGLAAKNFPFVYHEFSGEQHIFRNEITDYVHRDAVRWLLAHRNPRVPQDEDRLQAEGEVLEALQRGRRIDGARLLTVLCEARDNAEELLSAAAGSRSAEVRQVAARAYQQRHYVPAVWKPLQDLCLDREEAVAASALVAAGTHAIWQDREMRDFLCRTLRDGELSTRQTRAFAIQVAALGRMQRLDTRTDETIAGAFLWLNEQGGELASLAAKGQAGKVRFRGEELIIKD